MASPAEQASFQQAPWSEKLRSLGGWADAATYTMADLKMLRRELLIGFTVAGFLAVVVPAGLWNAVFIHGHGFATTLENAVVGPFIAVISFVCSIGNVPLAAALWKGGISFGGVVSFLFADLISFPLLLVYRRYYGTRLMVRMLVVFWAAMSMAGLITGEIFAAAGLVVRTHPVQVAPAHFSWDYTTYLNIVFIALFAVSYWVYRNRVRLGADSGACSTRFVACRWKRPPLRLVPATRPWSSTSVRTTAGCDSKADPAQLSRQGGRLRRDPQRRAPR